MLARAPGFEEALLVVDIEPTEVIGRRLRDVRRRALAREREAIPPVDGHPRRRARAVAERAQGQQRTVVPFVDELEQMRLALELGLRDYVDKNGFREIVVGVSGGIDSARRRRRSRPRRSAPTACTASRCRRATRRRRPARDARRLAREPRRRLPRDADRPDRRGVRRRRSRRRFAEPRARPDRGEHPGARPRRAADGAVEQVRLDLVATGNKSELSVGYATLYGDMAGGFALLKDVYKTDVFRLAHYLNERAGRELIPQSIIDRAPSAELRDRPARRGLAAAVPGARPCARGIRRARPLARGAAHATVRRGRRRARAWR